MFTNIGLVEYAKSKLSLPTIYMLSGFGRKLTSSQVSHRVNTMKCSHTIRNESRIRQGVGNYCFDCVGLIKGYLWEVEPGRVLYNQPSGSDQNVGMMYRSATEKGSIATMPDIKGLLVFTQDLGHVGIYVGKVNGVNQYIESTPAWNAWGVTTSSDKNHPQGHNRQWAFWGKYHLVEYLVPVNNKTYTVVRGDTLSRIANKVNMTWQELYEMNKDVIGQDPNKIEVGMMLRLDSNVVFVKQEVVREVIKEVVKPLDETIDKGTHKIRVIVS
jgi:LysM repeat protein